MKKPSDARDAAIRQPQQAGAGTDQHPTEQEDQHEKS
jgi:hypothetical protein